MTSFSMRSLKLRSGEEYRDEQEVTLEPLRYGGQRYIAVPEKIPGALAISRASTGTVFELRLDARLHGPCFRCLADAVLDVPVSAREYQANKADSDELRNPYLVEGKLDLSAWARDAVALALPDKILCRPDCAGLCAVCGKNLNTEPHVHTEARLDPRWAALAQLREHSDG